MSYDKVYINSIIDAAAKTGRTLTDKQALQVLTRHNQLVKEGRTLRREDDHYTQKEVDACWDWFYGLSD